MSARAKTASPSNARTATSRKSLLARIHIARKELALQEDSYRAILRRIAGQDSASAIDDAGLRKVIKEFERLGLKPRARRPASGKPHVRKVFALWTSMRDLVRDPSPAALRVFVQRQTGVADPEWLSPAQANAVIEGLKAWRARLERQAGQAEEQADE